jgi:P4 family phage/plasmid primase-like protien
MELENFNLIIDNIELKSFDFKKISNVNEYRLMSTTSQSIYFSKIISSYFKVVHSEQVYYFNTKTKLYTGIDKKQFDSFVYSFFDNSSMLIRKLLRKEETIDEQVEKKIKEMCESFDKEFYIQQIIKRSFSNLYDTKLISQLNSMPDIFPIKNGRKINLKTLEVSDRTKEDFFDYESPVEYLKDSKLKNANRFFSEVMVNLENRMFLKKVLGYLLTGDTSARKFFVWFGHGANAKSLIFNLVEKILCKQYSQCDKSIFVKVKSGKGASPELMDLMGKRTGVYSEGETADLIDINISLIKGISGEDLLKGRYLYGNLIEFRPYVKLNLLTNFKPPLDAEDAVKDRLVYIFLDSRFCHNPKAKNEFKIDTDFVNKLQNEYLSEIFTWIVQGSKDYYTDLKITMTKEFQDRTTELLSEQDSIESFFTRCVTITKDKTDYCKKNELFDSYKLFCNENSQRCQPRSTLWQRLDQSMSKGIVKSLLDGYDVYRYIQVNIFPKDKPKKSEDKCEPSETELLELEIEKLKNKIKKLKNKPKREEIIEYYDDDDNINNIKYNNNYDFDDVEPKPIEQVQNKNKVVVSKKKSKQRLTGKQIEENEKLLDNKESVNIDDDLEDLMKLF